MAELLIEIKDYHMVHLMDHDLCDAACLNNIFQVLRENKIIDDQKTAYCTYLYNIYLCLPWGRKRAALINRYL